MKNKELIIPIINKKFSDLNPIDVGYEKCKSKHSFGPHVRSYWLIHYVIKGKGILIKENEQTFRIHEGQAFLISPDLVYLYEADEKEPWEYIWIGFTGALAKDFENLGDVFSVDAKVFFDIVNAKDYKKCREEFLASKLFELYTSLFSDTDGRIDYVTQVCDYITAHYSEDITINGIAKIIGVDRTYLSKIFTQRTGKSMQQYLIDIRIKKAQGFLKKGYSVYETSVMVGYGDVSNFSKMFKRITGTSPKTVKIK